MENEKERHQIGWRCRSDTGWAENADQVQEK